MIPGPHPDLPKLEKPKLLEAHLAHAGSDQGRRQERSRLGLIAEDFGYALDETTWDRMESETCMPSRS